MYENLLLLCITRWNVQKSHSLPSIVERFQGNDHVIEYNHIHHMCWNSSDCGAIHSGRDWTWVRTLSSAPGVCSGLVLASQKLFRKIYFINNTAVNRANVIP